MNEERDAGLGRRIEALPAPEHRDGFWPALEARMRGANAATMTSGATGAAESRAPRRGAAIVAILAIAAVIALVVGVVLPSLGGQRDPERSVVAGPEGSATSDPTGAGTGSVVGRVDVPKSVSGTATVIDRSDGNDATTSYRFVRSIDGSYEVTSESTGDRVAYDAAKRRAIATYTYEDETSAAIDTNLAPGAPDRYPFTLLPGGLDLEQFVVSAAMSELDSIEEDTSRFGRETWTYDGPVTPNQLAGEGPDAIEATVDQETGILVRLVEKVGGRVLRELSVDTFVPSPAGVAEIDTSAPTGARVETVDHRFAEVSVDDLQAGRAGAAAPPLHPQRDDESCDPFCPPEGWELAGAWVLDGTGDPTGPEASNPPSTDVASLLYADGWRRVVVSTRALVDDAERWSDPFRGEGQRFEAEASFEMEGDGAFPGAEGSQIIDPASMPHIWAIACGDECEAGGGDGGYVLTVAGDASIQELRQFANVARSA